MLKNKQCQHESYITYLLHKLGLLLWFFFLLGLGLIVLIFVGGFFLLLFVFAFGLFLLVIAFFFIFNLYFLFDSVGFDDSGFGLDQLSDSTVGEFELQSDLWLSKSLLFHFLGKCGNSTNLVALQFGAGTFGQSIGFSIVKRAVKVLVVGECNGLFDSSLSVGSKDGSFLAPDFFALLGLLGLKLCQRNGNGEWVDIGQTDVANTEGSGDVGSKEGSSKSHTFVRVDVHTKFLVVQGCGKSSSDLWNTHSSSNHFNGSDVLQFQTSTLDGLVNWGNGTIHQIFAKFFKLGACNVQTQRHVIVQRIHVDRDLHIGRKYVLDLIGLDAKLGHGTRDGADILSMSTGLVPFGIEVIRQVFNQSVVKRQTTKSGIPSLTQYFNGSNSLCLFGVLSFLHLI
mmetsp:Transcript_40067/g.96735  ORF Transcript_40067/g.96735 Transcript_40067/m.96735 type:complete len:396 (-) Transcript_40067:885-2072(-)